MQTGRNEKRQNHCIYESKYGSTVDEANVRVNPSHKMILFPDLKETQQFVVWKFNLDLAYHGVNPLYGNCKQLGLTSRLLRQTNKFNNGNMVDKIKNAKANCSRKVVVRWILLLTADLNFIESSDVTKMKEKDDIENMTALYMKQQRRC